MFTFYSVCPAVLYSTVFFLYSSIEYQYPVEVFCIFKHVNFLVFFQDPIFLGNSIICWEQDWDDCFEVNEFVSKESLIFKVSTCTSISREIIPLRRLFKSFGSSWKHLQDAIHFFYHNVECGSKTKNHPHLARLIFLS